MTPIQSIGDPPGPPGVRYAEVKPGYVVGDDGSVWSRVVPGHRGRFGPSWRRLKVFRARTGLLWVGLGQGDRRFIHHVVLGAFVAPRRPGMTCRHIDGDPANNRAGNLAWITREEDAADRIRRGETLRGERNGYARLTTRAVRDAIRLHRAGAKPWVIARRFNVSREAIRDVLSGRTWGHVTGLGPAQHDCPESGQGRSTHCTDHQINNVR